MSQANGNVNGSRIELHPYKILRRVSVEFQNISLCQPPPRELTCKILFKSILNCVKNAVVCKWQFLQTFVASIQVMFRMNCGFKGVLCEQQLDISTTDFYIQMPRPRKSSKIGIFTWHNTETCT